MRSSRPQKARAQDDGLKNSFDDIFRIDLHAAMQHQIIMKIFICRSQSPPLAKEDLNLLIKYS